MAANAPLDQAQRDRVARHVDQVRIIARKVAPRLPSMELDELEGLGHEGLVDAVQRYDPTTGVTFGAFAYYRIRGAMIDGARRSNRAGRQHARALQRLEASQSLLEQAAADGAGASARDMQARVARARALVEQHAVSLMIHRNSGEDPEQIAARESSAEEAVMRGELRERLASAMRSLDPEDRELLEAIYDEERPMNVVAAELGVNKSTISRRHARILGELARRLGPRADSG